MNYGVAVWLLRCEGAGAPVVRTTNFWTVSWQIFYSGSGRFVAPARHSALRHGLPAEASAAPRAASLVLTLSVTQTSESVIFATAR